MTTTLETTPLTCRRSEDGIVSVELSSPERPLVILDRDLLDRLEATMSAVHESVDSDGLTGFILRSACPRVFVAGADLREIDDLDDDALLDYLAEGSRVLGMIASLPCPSVALIDGAALGGGLEIAMHCDALICTRRSGSGKPYPIGLPECSLGLLPGWGGTQMLPARIDPTTALGMIIDGKPAMSDDLPAGLVEATVETAGELEDAAMSWISSHQASRSGESHPRCLDGKHPGTIQGAVDRIRKEDATSQESCAVLDAVETGLHDGWDAAVAREQRHLVDLRNTERTRGLLEAFFQKQGS